MHNIILKTLSRANFDFILKTFSIKPNACLHADFLHYVLSVIVPKQSPRFSSADDVSPNSPSSWACNRMSLWCSWHSWATLFSFLSLSSWRSAMLRYLQTEPVARTYTLVSFNFTLRWVWLQACWRETGLASDEVP